MLVSFLASIIGIVAQKKNVITIIAKGSANIIGTVYRIKFVNPRFVKNRPVGILMGITAIGMPNANLGTAMNNTAAHPTLQLAKMMAIVQTNSGIAMIKSTASAIEIILA